MSSHARVVWILDNVGPLRQYERELPEGDLVLFVPATADL